MADIDAQIIPLAQRQHSLFTRNQARAAGATRHQFEHRLTTGVWERRSNVVLALGGAPPSFEQSVMAACLQTEGNVASHRAAAVLRGVPQVAGVVEVTSLYGSSRNPFGLVHRSADLLSDDIDLIGTIPVTTLARTAADLFTCLRPARAEWVIEGLLGRGQLTIEELAEVHGRFARQGRPATVHLRDLLAHLDEAPPLMSEMEQRLRALVLAVGLDEPQRQVPLPGWVDHPAHVDFAYPEHRLIIEVDSRSWHSRFTEFELDRRRDNAAQVAGWTVLRFTWRQVTQDRDYVVATIRAALRRAA
jgi:very-short-patch-repair endonuclease